MASDVDAELVNLLKNDTVTIDIKNKGWHYILGLTATEDGLDSLTRSEKYIPFILSFVASSATENTLLNVAYKCLINISNNEAGSIALLKHKKDLPKFLLCNICNDKENNIQEKCYILANLTVHPSINNQVTNILSSTGAVLQNLMKVYFSSDVNLRSKYDFLTLVFSNVSKLTEGRRLFLEDVDFLSRILTFTNIHEPEAKRLGAALILRNCCLDIESHEKLLNDVCILPAILLPLMNSEEYEETEMEKLPLECQYLEETKERDPSPSVRKILVQILITLCYSEFGWSYLKSHGTYYVARNLHKCETHGSVKETLEQLVTYMLVEQYTNETVPKNSANLDLEEDILITELQSNVINDIPDFVI